VTEPASARMTLAEFLEWDDGTDTRYELFEGRPVAMALPLVTHGTIVGNLAREIGSRLKPPCLAQASRRRIGPIASTAPTSR